MLPSEVALHLKRRWKVAFVVAPDWEPHRSRAARLGLPLFGKRPMKAVLAADPRFVLGSGSEGRYVGSDDEFAGALPKATAQAAGVSWSIREAGWVATRSRTSLKYRKGSTPASLQPWVSV